MNARIHHRRDRHHRERDDADPAGGDRRTRGREERRAQSRHRGHDARRRDRRLSRSPSRFQQSGLADAAPWLVGAPWLGVLAGAAAGAAASMLFGLLVLSLGSNQVATGLGAGDFRHRPLVADRHRATSASRSRASIRSSRMPGPKIPIGKLFFGYSPLVYFAFIAVFAVYWFLNRTRAGLVLRAVGENDLSARSIGYSVIGVRYGAIAFGGAMAGIAGSYFSMVITPLWAEQGMTAGRGWIALALVVFSGWRSRAAARRRLFLRPVHDAGALCQGLRILLPSLAVLGFDALSDGDNRSRGDVGARERRRRGSGLPRQDRTCPTREASSQPARRREMNVLTRRNFREVGRRGVGAAAARPQRFRRRAAESRLHLSRARSATSAGPGRTRRAARRWSPRSAARSRPTMSRTSTRTRARRRSSRTSRRRATS